MTKRGAHGSLPSRLKSGCSASRSTLLTLRALEATILKLTPRGRRTACEKSSIAKGERGGRSVSSRGEIPLEIEQSVRMLSENPNSNTKARRTQRTFKIDLFLRV